MGRGPEWKWEEAEGEELAAGMRHLDWGWIRGQQGLRGSGRGLCRPSFIIVIIILVLGVPLPLFSFGWRRVLICRKNNGSLLFGWLITTWLHLTEPTQQTPSDINECSSKQSNSEEKYRFTHHPPPHLHHRLLPRCPHLRSPLHPAGTKTADANSQCLFWISRKVRVPSWKCVVERSLNSDYPARKVRAD